MNDQIQNKIITIQSINDEGNRIVIKDQDNTTYSFFKQKQSGEKTQAFEHFQMNNHNDAFKVGDSANIGFTTKESTIQGKNVTFRNIISMLATFKTPEPEVEYHPAPSTGTDWERIGRLKAVHNLVGRRLSAGQEPEQVLSEIPIFVNITNAIEKAVDTMTTTDSVHNEDIRVEDIPF